MLAHSSSATETPSGESLSLSLRLSSPDLAHRDYALVLITIFKFRPTCARRGQWASEPLNGRVIARRHARLHACACASERRRRRRGVLRTKITTRREKGRLLTKHSIGRADNSLLASDQIYAPVARITMCPGSFPIAIADPFVLEMVRF